MLLIATHNTHKFKEITQILAPIPCRGAFEMADVQVEETGLTFIENALIKARYYAKHTQGPVMADDSGLVVPALNGAPGIYSARYAGNQSDDAKNRQLLLTHLQGIENPKAYFYCAMVIIRYEKDPTPLVGLGEWHGSIIDEERGEHGFGYDPIFYLDTHQCTAAQLNPQEKNQLSHRAQALSQLKQSLLHHDFLPHP